MSIYCITQCRPGFPYLYLINKNFFSEEKVREKTLFTVSNKNMFVCYTVYKGRKREQPEYLISYLEPESERRKNEALSHHFVIV
jgi:hypothetical protein